MILYHQRGLELILFSALLLQRPRIAAGPSLVQGGMPGLR
jgi:hypothetical protein